MASEYRDAIPSELTTVLIATPDGSRTLDPRFAKLPHQFTVVLNGLTDKHSAITPIAWTRGLDPETGKWHKDSPYGGEGGHIVFLGGKVQFYRELTNSARGKLVARDGRPTHRILDALPAGARISDNPKAPELSPTWGDHLSEIASGSSNAIRSSILLAWPLWMVALFVKLTLGFARTWGVPLANVRLEPRSRWLVLTPAALLIFSVLFRL